MEKGFCWASTRYLAEKQRTTERTVYRWLAKLKQYGYIDAEVDTGIERRLTPSKPPQKLRGTPHRFIQSTTKQKDDVRGKQGKLDRGFVRGLPYDAYTQETTTNAGTGAKRATHRNLERLAPTGQHEQERLAPDELNGPGAEVFAAMLRVGVTKSRAIELLRGHGLELVKLQLDALPWRKAKDAASVLVQSIKEDWNIPQRITQEIQRKQQDAQKAQNAALSAALERKRTQTRETLRAAFSGQSDAMQYEYRTEAERLVHSEIKFGMKVPEAGLARLIETRALQLFADSGGGDAVGVQH